MLSPLSDNLLPLGLRVAAFSPDHLPGLRLWLKADAIAGLSDGDAVAAWPDSSGNGNDASQGVAGKRPTWRANVLGGRPVVRFDGVDDFLTGGPIGGAGLTWVAAARVTPAAGSVRGIMDTAGGGDVAGNGGFLVSFEDRGGTAGTNTLGCACRTGTTGTPGDLFRYWGRNGSYAAAAFVVVAFSYGAADPRYLKNGADQAPYDAFLGSTGTNAYGASALGYTLGAFGSGSLPVAMDLAEVLVYDSVLGTSERQSVEAYLFSRYAIAP